MCSVPLGYGSRDSVNVAEVPSRLATRIAVDFATTVPADNVKEALLEPAETRTDDGMVTFAEFAPSPRATLTVSIAADVRVTVHVVLPSERIDVAAHDSLEILAAGRIVSVAPLAVAGTVFAVPETAVRPVRPSTDDAGACKDTAKFAVASTPFGMNFVFSPHMMQRTCPVPPLAQDSDFPEELNAVPAVSFMPLNALVEYVRVHSRALGSELEEGESIVMLAEPEPPATAVPGTILMPVWANATGTISKNQNRHKLIRQHSSLQKM